MVTISLIALNALMFLYQLQLDDVSLQRLAFNLGVIPAYLSYGDIVTSMFLHGDFLHFLGNMVFLWIFGPTSRSGRHGVGTLLYRDWRVRRAGPGVRKSQLGRADHRCQRRDCRSHGRLLSVYPHCGILTAVFLILFLDIVEIPAIFFLGVWSILQLVNGSISGGDGGGVAVWAHAGGFAAGVAIGLYLRVRDRATQAYWQDVR